MHTYVMYIYITLWNEIFVHLFYVYGPECLRFYYMGRGTCRDQKRTGGTGLWSGDKKQNLGPLK